ncbi:class I SAM-dependent methyltransferase [Halopseudomonas oceani]|uniref:class I SAM-dependent methyltransferase n=1 Tax=Halopseudomonas oceani TaxID=1708783 RepID=UPI002AA69C9D|nr:class I SAM-dependent methyltransferase [Halopseudomonas oceani]
MDDKALRELFDRQAAGYDQQWAHMAPIRDALHFLLEAVFFPLPVNANVLCVGAGTGQELLHLAIAHPSLRFTAVEPAGAMLEQCQLNAERLGVADRCTFHHGYLDSLTDDPRFDAATSFLVSQFILDRHARTDFFQQIARRLKPGGLLANADLTGCADPEQQRRLIALWAQAMSAEPVTADTLHNMQQVYSNDVAVLPAAEVESIISAGGFSTPVVFHQAGMIQAWAATRRL